MHDLITGQITSSAVIVYVLQILKNAKWFPWISQKTDRLNRLLAILLAGVAAVGIHVSYQAEGGVLTISGLTLIGVVGGAWDWLRSFVMQELIYRGAVKNGGASAKPIA